MNLIPVVTLLGTLFVTVLVTRIATVALALTGLSRESARFQARSALTGVGFTSSETEKVVNHPVRRRIIMMLMLLGNAGIVTCMATLMASFVNNTEGTNWVVMLAVMSSGLLVLALVTRSRWIDRQMSRIIERSLRRWTKIDVRDYVSFFHLSDGYSVSEIQVDPTDWLADRSLAELRLPDEGVMVLGIERPLQDYIGAPNATTEIVEGDTLIIYGPGHRIEELNQRRSGPQGSAAHKNAVEEQAELQRQQESVEESTDVTATDPEASE